MTPDRILEYRIIGIILEYRYLAIRMKVIDSPLIVYIPCGSGTCSSHRSNHLLYEYIYVTYKV